MKRYYSDRHKAIAAKLIRACTKRNKSYARNFAIAAKLKVSVTTVRAYTLGHITDGYLAEDIYNHIISEE
jgi:hypothetical protein